MPTAWWRTMALALLLALAPSAFAADPPRVVGYVMDHDPLPAVSAEKLDAVIYGFALVDSGHTVHFPRPGMSQRLDQLAALRRRNPGLKVLLGIGGWGADHFSEAAATENGRLAFARTAVAMVRRHDLDGLDIDWEYPTLPGPGISHAPADRDNFPLLLRAVRQALDALSVRTGKRYLLTIAAAGGEAARGLDLPRIVPLVDAIHLMTFDFHGRDGCRTGHHAGLHRSALAGPADRDTMRAVDEFLAAGVPPRKLLPGIAFHGKRFTGVAPGNDGLYQPCDGEVTTLSWREVRDHLLTDGGFVRHWDEQAQAAWLWNPRTRVFVTYEDPEAIRAKARHVRERGLGGVMYREHGADANEQLLDIAREALGLP